MWLPFPYISLLNQFDGSILAPKSSSLICGCYNIRKYKEKVATFSNLYIKPLSVVLKLLEPSTLSYWQMPLSLQKAGVSNHPLNA